MAYKLSFIPDKPTSDGKASKTSTLYYRRYESFNDGRKPISTKKSVGLSVLTNTIEGRWNKRLERFRETGQFKNENIELNQDIESFLRKNGFRLDANFREHERSFLKYWQSIIDSNANHGSRIKHITIKNRLIKYLKSRNQTDLLFREIDTNFLRLLYYDFKTVSYIREYSTESKTEKQQIGVKKLSTNSANHYIKVIKSVIKKAQEEKWYTFDNDPFISLQLSKYEDVSIDGKVLPRKSLNLLGTMDQVDSKEGFSRGRERLNKKFDEADLTKYRLSFLFQVFANGMRVSDLLLLRWNNILSGGTNGVLKYKMYKTKKEMTMPLNLNLCKIISKLIDPEQKKTFQRTADGQHTKSLVLNGVAVELNLNQIDEQISQISNAYDISKPIPIGYVKVENRNVLIERMQDYITLIINKKELLAELEKHVFGNITFYLATRLGKGYETKFIFPFLKDEDFVDIGSNNDFTKINEIQYKSMKSASILYNRKLKVIAKAIGLNPKISTHTARHSFASYLLDMGDVSTYHIQKTLGHSNLRITDKYLQSHFNPEKLDDTNRRLSYENFI